MPLMPLSHSCGLSRGYQRFDNREKTVLHVLQSERKPSAAFRRGKKICRTAENRGFNRASGKGTVCKFFWRAFLAEVHDRRQFGLRKMSATHGD